MTPRLRTIMLLALALPLGAGIASAQGSLRSGNAVFDRAVEIVLANFYRPAELDRFRDAVTLTVENFPGLAKAEPALVDDAIDFVLSEPRDLAHRPLCDGQRRVLRAARCLPLRRAERGRAPLPAAGQHHL